MADVPSRITAIFRCFGALKDKRLDRTKFHPLINVITIALLASIAGAEGWDDIAEFARIRKEWLSTFLDMPRGTPSADTVRRVISNLHPAAFDECVRKWVASLQKELVGEVIAVDGKALKGAFERAGSTTPLHLLHVWATEQRLLLAKRAVAGSPGEIGGASELLNLLRIEGAIVTLDANGCTPRIAATIVDGGADYVLALKGNRGAIHADVKGLFEELSTRGFSGARRAHVEERGHGRREERTVYAVEPGSWPDDVAAHAR